MKKFLLFFVTVNALLLCQVYADILALDIAVAETRDSCNGISDELKSLQTMAGINTAITGIGTVAGGGALYAGIQKKQLDEKARELWEYIKDIEDMSDDAFFMLLVKLANYKEASEIMDKEWDEDILNMVDTQSKNFGNWRTGLMAGNTATNIAGTVIANKNKNAGKGIVVMVNSCLDSLIGLRAAWMQARLDGADIDDLILAQRIVDECGKYNIRDLEKIPRRSDIAKWSSAVGIGTGAAGTVTSVVANTENIRNAARDTQDGVHKNAWEKEQNLNTASNILAGASTVASGIATGFNIATITVINKALGVANSCEYMLR
ncbi:MAG: hypothetical protein FWG80_00845 [Alphaproteobacteria bacterium]|nr:hypothetical protein [Alphaproteobacteria bacterium]